MINSSYLSTEFFRGFFLLGPVLSAQCASHPPDSYLNFQLLVGLLQPVHLLQEALQTSVHCPHDLTGVLQRVHAKFTCVY